jgi:hypothetical protein
MCNAVGRRPRDQPNTTVPQLTCLPGEGQYRSLQDCYFGFSGRNQKDFQ